MRQRQRKIVKVKWYLIPFPNERKMLIPVFQPIRLKRHFIFSYFHIKPIRVASSYSFEYWTDINYLICTDSVIFILIAVVSAMSNTRNSLKLCTHTQINTTNWYMLQCKLVPKPLLALKYWEWLNSDTKKLEKELKKGEIPLYCAIVTKTFEG